MKPTFYKKFPMNKAIVDAYLQIMHTITCGDDDVPSDILNGCIALTKDIEGMSDGEITITSIESLAALAGVATIIQSVLEKEGSDVSRD